VGGNDVKTIGSPCLDYSEQFAKIYVGSSFSVGQDIKGIVIGLEENGSPNTEFEGGHVILEEPGNRVRIEALAVAGPRVLMAGAITSTTASEGDAFVAGYKKSGKIDTSFGEDGKSIIPGEDGRKLLLNSMTLKPDGTILASGYSKRNDEAQGLLTVHNDDGSFSSNFNKGTPLYAAFVNTLYFLACHWQEDGKIIVTGMGENGCLIVARYNPDGSQDSAFGEGGAAIYRQKANSSHEDSTLTKDSKTVLLGIQSNQPFALRYLA
jgi:uncharacterized delta-60 repeat protein